MELQEVINKRQSIRKYKDIDIPEDHIAQIVAAAGTAPSGKNSQNWHFVSIKNPQLKEKIKQVILTKNESICAQMDSLDKEKGDKFRKFVNNFTFFFMNAPVLTVIFGCEYKPSGYHELRFIDASLDSLYDLVSHRNPGMQSVGAAVENFTLKAIDMGYGTCWLTSANYAASEIESLLKKEIGFEKEGYFMVAMISLGVPEENQKSPKKKPLEEIFTFIG